MSALIANPVFRVLLRALLVWAPLWISTTILFGLIGLSYVLFLKQDTFLASQALLVRDEATGAVMRLGRFGSQAEMKAAQETILEMAKSQQVVRDALIAVGQPNGISNWLGWSEYPSKDLIEDVAKSSISVHAPKGTEFGVTEVIYMDVKANAKDEAMQLSKALTDALESRLQQVRKARADGVLAELTHARDSAKRELANSTSRLREIESEAGSDLSDLRGMTDTVAGAATSRAELDQTKNELRQAEISRQALIADREMLINATKDPSSFIVAPGAVLNSQPGLKRLREGLVDAQLSGSQLTGKFTENHPSVIASQSSQSSIVGRFLQELRASITGVESDISLVDGRIERLETQKLSAQDRLGKLADSRAAYANLLSEVKSKVGILENSERELAEIQAARDSSISTSLLTRLDSPIVSDRPLGPGKSTILALCTLAGLVFGLGIVFVVTPIDASPIFGRRSVDRQRGRRDADAIVASKPDFADIKVDDTASANKTKDAIDEIASSGTFPIADSEGQVDPKVATYSKLNLQSSIALARDESNAFENQSLGLKITESYQPLIKPRSDAALTKVEEQNSPAKSQEATSTLNVDLAFQELAKIQARGPENRSEELSLQIKVQELKGFLSNPGTQVKKELATDSGEPPRVKPRATRPT